MGSKDRVVVLGDKIIFPKFSKIVDDAWQSSAKKSVRDFIQLAELEKTDDEVSLLVKEVLDKRRSFLEERLNDEFTPYHILLNSFSILEKELSQSSRFNISEFVQKYANENYLKAYCKEFEEQFKGSESLTNFFIDLVGYVKEGEITRIMPDKRQWVMAVESEKVANYIKEGIKVNNHGLKHDCSGYESNFTKEGDILVFVQRDKLENKTYIDAINKMGLKMGNIYAVDVDKDYEIYPVNNEDLRVVSESQCSLDEICKNHFQVPDSSIKTAASSSVRSGEQASKGV
ncbi:MAG: hypothetical protein CMP18_01215 [Rickettsiales bacterium]|jgi:hypothetical protein|nr:hypothetical protein [Rickettsiales bacterium]|tara:strand:- start:6571 stop:7431 length:861 start_codon:yes stop_codon:yes gene_type:complete